MRGFAVWPAVRIVSLVPSLTLAVHRLGRTDDLVGVTRYCIHPAEALEDVARVGGTKDPDLDAIRALGPDLVLANTDEQRADDLGRLEELAADTGATVLVTETDSLADVAATWSQLGDAVDAPEAAAKERTRIEEALTDARARLADAPRLSALVPVWKHPWMATGGGTYVSDLIGACGFDNILGETDEKWVRFVPSSDPAAATVVEKGPAAGTTMHGLPRVPDVVLLPTEPYAFDDADREDFLDLGIPRERVRVADGELMTWWLTHTADALVSFTALHDELLDVVQTP